MDVSVTQDPLEVDRAVDVFLAAKPERNVPGTLLLDARASSKRGEPRTGQLFAWGVEAGEIVCFALRMPPWPIVVTELDEDGAAELLERWLPEDPLLPGVGGVAASALAIARAWEARAHAAWKIRLSEAIHVLEHVIPPPVETPGELRRAGPRDRDLLVEWQRAFQREASMNPGGAEEARRAVDRRLAAGLQWVWEDGAVVSTAGCSHPFGGRVRIGPVYTPAPFRRRGYAAAAVAAVSERALAAGAEQCMLYTDLANPTSNRIYASIGYRRHCDWLELLFDVSVSRFTSR